MTENKPYQQTSDDVEQVKWDAIRSTRSILLEEADNLVSTALDKGIEATKCRQYRQALRDIPQTHSDPDDVIWPEKPTV